MRTSSAFIVLCLAKVIQGALAQNQICTASCDIQPQTTVTSTTDCQNQALGTACDPWNNGSGNNNGKCVKANHCVDQNGVQTNDFICGCSKGFVSGGGDPHFTTWNGEKFSFHGECDLVLIHNPEFANGVGMHIHGRTKIHHKWSAFESAAIRIGHDVLEVHGKTDYWINGSPNVKLPATIGGYKVTMSSKGPHIRSFTIHLGNDGKIINVKAYDQFIWVSIKKANDEFLAGASGLFGSYGSGHKVGRDGVTLINDPNAFGQEWQVRDTDPMLFHEAEGPQYPEECKLPERTMIGATENIHRGLRGNTEDEYFYESVLKACADADANDIEDCISDVMATKRIELADAYLYSNTD